MFTVLKALRSRLIFTGVAGILSLAPVSFGGRIPGPVMDHRDRVMAHDTDTYDAVFEGGEAARVMVIGDGDTRLGLFIYDENGNLVASNTINGDPYIVHFTPQWTGRFRIVVRNYGAVYNRYGLWTN